MRSIHLQPKMCLLGLAALNGLIATGTMASGHREALLLPRCLRWPLFCPRPECSL